MLSDEEIRSIYELVRVYWEKHLKDRGVKLPHLIKNGKYMLCLISLALALRLLKDNISTSMIYIIKILQMTEISTFPASILDKAVSILKMDLF